MTGALIAVYYGGALTELYKVAATPEGTLYDTGTGAILYDVETGAILTA